MRIKHAVIKHFMGIKLFDVTFGDGAVHLAGNNGQGKTSAMLAIIGALGGKTELAKALGLPKDPGDNEIIKRGEQMAEVVVEFGGWVVTWQRERGKSDKVEIRGADDGVHGRKKLTELIGAIAFDPLAIDAMSPAERRETLLEMAGIDLEEIDGRRDVEFQTRHLVNRDHKQALARVGDEVKGAPAETFDVGALELALSEAADRCRENDAQRKDALTAGANAELKRSAADRAAGRLQEWESAEIDEQCSREKEAKAMKERHGRELVEIRRQHRSAAEFREERITRAKLEADKARGEANDESGKAQAAKLSSSKLVDPSLEAAEGAIRTAREANQLYRMAQERLGRHAEAEKLGAASRDLTATLAEIDADKVAMLAGAKMPIDGLGVGDDDATIDGHLWATTNFSRRLQVCVAIAAEMAGELKIAFLRSGGNDLDDENYAALLAECKRHGLQPWIERNNPGEGAIVIEQGLVKP